MVTIRKVLEKDIEQVATLQIQFTQTHRHFNPDFYNLKDDFSKVWKEYAIKCLTNKDKLFIVAEEKDQIVGYAIATISQRAPVYNISKIGILDAITVDPNHQRKGIASKLLEQCLAWFKENNLEYVEAFIDSKNISSLKLNEKFGFKEYQKRMLLKL